MDIKKYSNPNKVFKNAEKEFGKKVMIKVSTKPEKKYMIYDPIKNKYIYFGQMGYEDYTKHNDPLRRQNYLKRTANIKGDWKKNPYSPNNLSRTLLW
jgi:hypothetical protein